MGPPGTVPIKHRNLEPAASVGGRAEPLIAAAVNAFVAEAGGPPVSPELDGNSGQKQQSADAEAIDAKAIEVAEDLQPRRRAVAAAAPATEGEAEAGEGAPVDTAEARVPSGAAETDKEVAAAEAAVEAADGDSLQPPEEVLPQAESSHDPLLPADGSESRMGSVSAADGAAAAAGQASELGGRQGDHSAAAAGSMPGEAAETGCEAGADSGRSSFQEPAEEGSQVALLPPAEVSLKQPRLSQLSSFLSCTSSRAGGDNGETVSKRQVLTLIVQEVITLHHA